MPDRFCSKCGHKHGSDDARAVGRFERGGIVGYRAAGVPGAPVRATRAEAVADRCAYRVRSAVPLQLPVIAEEATPRPDAPPRCEVPPQPFPAALMETAARAKAWHDFLAQARLSLLVWEIDESIRRDTEHAVAWLRRCSGELSQLVASTRPPKVVEHV